MNLNRIIRWGVSLSTLALGGCVDAGATGATATQTDVERVSEASGAVVTACPFPEPTEPIAFEKELVIRHRSVVDDPCRTTWTGAGCLPERRGVWTFGHMMTLMAGVTSPDDPVAKQFMARWLSTWETDQTINGHLVARRSGIRAVLIDPWLQASGCMPGAPLLGPGACALDLRKAPFRLLAFVNRVDLSGSASHGNAAAHASGEFRVVFGALNLDQLQSAAPDDRQGVLDATVVLEYHLPQILPGHTWAYYLHGLSTIPLPASSIPHAAPHSTVFSDALQARTDGILRAGTDPWRPNRGSFSGQVRTNEVSFDISAAPGDKVWEMREHRLQCPPGILSGCQLVTSTTAQTPPNTLAGTASLSTYLIDDQAQIETASHSLSAYLRGAASQAPTGAGPLLWSNPDPTAISGLARHGFSLSTCNGCHHQETSATSHFHIAPRKATMQSGLSPFLAASIASSSGDMPDEELLLDDPDLTTGLQFAYNEPWRRACEVRRLLTGRPSAYTSPIGHF
ncbi:hypothetical protein [Chondromyces apiculatus]|uniref:Lipoprotein n=1 Tax=Chondromyces apiculatus DSM 436 TaxID=1192034 RepID=A0A017TCB7_9BACT|nr:hypothetical protein [Chondromyces apiculatus]EYF06899.1 Hypothetical protein CAP_1157 [Chondromyces apiculatus DSM 436]